MKVLLTIICCLLFVTCALSQTNSTRKRRVRPNTLSKQPASLYVAPENPTDRKVIGRIINGDYATTIADFSFQVKLFLKSRTESTPTEDVFTTCGGSIIGTNWILTAAHCIVDADEGYVYVGCVNTEDETGSCRKIFVTPDHFYWHADFVNDDRDTQKDIGLIWFSDTLDFKKSAPNIGPIALNTDPCIKAGQGVVLSGFGLTEKDQLSDKLKFTSVKIIDESQCKRTFPTVNPSMICFGNNGYTSDCQGDSGGPMTMNVKGVKYLVGVVSYGGPTCLNYPGVYTRVSYYLNWICYVTKICVK